MQKFSKKNNTIIERILQLIEYHNITKYKFCKDLGLSNGFLDKPREITTDKYAKILEYFPNVNPEWLLTGKGSMLRTETDDDTTEIKAKPISEKPTDGRVIPLLPANAIAGFGSGELQVKDIDIEQWYMLPDFPNAEFLITISGDSMLPTYKPGDIAICKKVNNINNIVWGRLYVIYSHDMGALFKRIYPSNQDDYLLLRSDNPAFPDILILKSDIITISLVLGIIRKD